MAYEITHRDTVWGERVVVHSHGATKHHRFSVFRDESDTGLVLVGKASIDEDDSFGGDIPPSTGPNWKREVTR
jgi:hypothetical protein